MNNNITRYIITGANGHLGSTIIRHLCDFECEIYGLLLPNESGKISHNNVKYFHGDVCDMNSLKCLFEDSSNRDLIVIHTAALISISNKVSQKVYDVNVNGVKNIVALCKEFNVKRLVHVSSVHAIEELPNNEIIYEPSKFSPDLVVGEYAKTKAEGVMAVLEGVNQGLDAVIVFPSGILGPYDEGHNHLVQMVSTYIKGNLPASVKGGYNFVDVRDVAQGCVLAAQNGRKGEGYILSGHYMPINKLLVLVSHYCNAKIVPTIPMEIAKMFAPVIEYAGKVRKLRPLYTKYSLHTLSSNSNFSNEKAIKELGYSPRDINDTVRDMVKWLTKVDK